MMVSTELCHYGLPVHVCAYVRVYVCAGKCEIVSSVYFIAPCECSGCGGQKTVVTPFPPGSYPVPSTAAVVQPVSDLRCVHTDIAAQGNIHINWQDMIAHVTLK